MEKAYDVQDLVARFKARGLDVAEDGAKAMVEELFSWFEVSVKLSSTPFDDVALAVVPHLKKAALEAIDRVDGKVG